MLFAGALSLIGATVWPRPAAADGPEAEAEERVLVRVAPTNEQVTARLRAELSLLGLTPVRLEASANTPTLGPDLLDRLADYNASAAIEIAMTAERIDLWVADGNTGKTLNRRLDLALDPEQGDPRTLAIAAVELLRASRLELTYTSPGPSDERDADPAGDAEQIRESERPPRGVELPSFGAISIAPMVGGSPGGFGATTHIELAGRWAPRDRFALRASVWIPTLGNDIGTADGNVRLLVGMAFIEPQLLLPGGVRWFHPELGLGVGGAIVGLVGSANDGLRGESKVLPGFTSYAHAGFGFAVSPRLWIRLDGFLGVLLPQPNVQSLGETVGTWGAPFGAGAIGLEVWL